MNRYKVWIHLVEDREWNDCKSNTICVSQSYCQQLLCYWSRYHGAITPPSPSPPPSPHAYTENPSQLNIGNRFGQHITWEFSNINFLLYCFISRAHHKIVFKWCAQFRSQFSFITFTPSVLIKIDRLINKYKNLWVEVHLSSKQMLDATFGEQGCDTGHLKIVITKNCVQRKLTVFHLILCVLTISLNIHPLHIQWAVSKIKPQMGCRMRRYHHNKYFHCTMLCYFVVNIYHVSTRDNS